MQPQKVKPGNIAEYIAAAPEQAQAHLIQLYDCVRAAAPGATEGLKWGMPAFSYHRILVTFAGFKRHIGFYPTPSAVKAFEKQLTKYKTAEGSVQFALDKPLPLPLVRKITLYRVKESLQEDKKWKG